MHFADFLNHSSWKYMSFFPEMIISRYILFSVVGALCLMSDIAKGGQHCKGLVEYTLHIVQMCIRMQVWLTDKKDKGEAAYHAGALDHVCLWTAVFLPTWALDQCLSPWSDHSSCKSAHLHPLCNHCCLKPWQRMFLQTVMRPFNCFHIHLLFLFHISLLASF